MISLADVTEAQSRISGLVHRTPTVHSTSLSRRLGAEVFVKLELFQKTGSFKPRGAFNVMLSLSDEERARGVVGFSGGNFAQGMAYAGRTLGVDTLVLMPETTPRHYVDATSGYGAAVELVPDITAAMEGVAAHAAAGRTPMHPFDDTRMMAGNGTVGLEIVEDVPALSHLFVSVGGGGLITGVATAVLGLRPSTEIVAVETEGADALARSLVAGEAVTIQPTSIAKTLGSPYAAADAIELAATRLAGVDVVSDAQAVAALGYIAERMKVLTEPAAACTLAAADGRADGFGKGSQVVLLLCGGNVALDDIADWNHRFSSLLTSATMIDGSVDRTNQAGTPWRRNASASPSTSATVRVRPGCRNAFPAKRAGIASTNFTHRPRSTFVPNVSPWSASDPRMPIALYQR